MRYEQSPRFSSVCGRSALTKWTLGQVAFGQRVRVECWQMGMKGREGGEEVRWRFGGGGGSLRVEASAVLGWNQGEDGLGVVELVFHRCC